MTALLYDLSDDYAALTDADDLLEIEALDDAIRAIEDSSSAKVLSLAKLVKSLEAEAELLEQHARAINGRAAVRRRRVEDLKRWIRLLLDASGTSKLKDPFVTVWLQASPPSVQVLDPDAVPGEFQRAVLRLPLSHVPAGLRGLIQNLDVDRQGILAAVQATGEVPDGVSIRRDEKHVRIR